MSIHDHNLPPNCLPSDIPGFTRYFPEAFDEDKYEIEYYRKEYETPPWKLKMDARLKEEGK